MNGIFFNTALIITAASMVIYTYGLLSPSTAIAFFSISLCTLALAAKKIFLNIHNKSQSIEYSEGRHSFLGYCFRTYTDANGTLWLRDESIRKSIKTERSTTYMRRKYPQYFRKANPVLDAWYVHPKALRAMIGSNSAESDNDILYFLENQVIGVHYGLLSLGYEKNKIPEPLIPEKKRWAIRFWNGELGLINTLLSGGISIYLVGTALGLLYPDEFVLHYQRVAILTLVSIVVTGCGLFWWGHGIILSALQWVASGRSVLMAFTAIMLAVYLVIMSLDPFVKKYNQYSFVEWLSIAADTDEKAVVYYDPGLQATVISGPLGFGTTIIFQNALKKSPNTQMISLKSYGGRVAEGEALNRIIRERNLDTYVGAECMSSCVISYVAGKNRYITLTARFGLHRSGYHWETEDNGPNETDEYIADIMRNAGVHESMIMSGMIPSIQGIYLPSAQEVLDANLATHLR